VGGQLGNVAFVIWRESVEALLVIGILNAWLAQQQVEASRGRLFLWAGVVAGLLVAVILGGALVLFGEALPDDAQLAYQTAAVLIAGPDGVLDAPAWAHAQARPRDLAAEGGRSLELVGVFVLAMIAVAREGSETVVFLYGTLAAARSGAVLAPFAVALFGFGLALGTYYLLQLGGRFLSWRVFFRLTEIMLLFLAASLLVTGVDNLIELGVLPSLSGRLWDTSAILPNSGPLGGLVDALTGYRARPDLMQLLIYALYWSLMCWALFRTRPVAKAA